MKGRIYNFQGINLKLSPFLQNEGELLRCVNMSDDIIGCKEKRPGYTTYLGTPTGGPVYSLWSWRKNNGTQFWNYHAANGTIYYSQQGTGNWTLAGNGTMEPGTYIFNSSMEDTQIICDGVAATRHTTSGTNFVDTTAAPVSRGMVDYQGRIYAIGTSSTLFWSNVGTPTDWTNDSSSINIPGPGQLNSIMKVNDRIITTKNSGVMHRYEGFNLVDMSTDLGPSAAISIGRMEDYRFYMNRLGAFGFGGDRPEIISNAIEKQIYNDSDKGIVGDDFDIIPGIAYKYNYYCSIGTIADDFTNGTITNCILKYNYQLNQWSNYSFAQAPACFGTYQDSLGSLQMIFGERNSGQIFQMSGTATTDAGSTIEAIMEFVIHAGSPESDKEWKYFWASFNPGNQAKVQIALSDTFTLQKLVWQDLGDCNDGVAEFRFPAGSQGKLLFVKIYEASRNNRFQFFGCSYEADVIDRK